MAGPAKSTPRDAQVMAAILKDMGVLDYEPRLINQMLEFTYRYITDVLDDAKVYSSHANKKNLDCDDIKLAIQCRMDHSFTTPPPRDLLMDIARYRNAQQLPLIKPYSQPRLPPDRYCLSAPNYKLKTLRKPRSQITLSNSIPAGGPRFSISSLAVKGTGSTGGGQTLTVVTKAVSQPTVTIISKSAATTMPKPTFRINTGSLPSYTKVISQNASGVNTVLQTSSLAPSSMANLTTSSIANLTTSSMANLTPSNITMSGMANIMTSGMVNLTTSSGTNLAPVSISNLTTSSVPNLMTQSLSTSNTTSVLMGSSLVSNPLKRKADDDDYDK
ncbi:transcription initiation factor TFIID subunit 9B-like [Gigantopelta aegis]|uniref:transcription initiation factor TFIID subunit 9B-like n=1 Tax=Gigantopelta aegis TaxID=1735272 RepID=UPI001B88E1BE|nr:transcription initiation factor TFIID subunit 9B-like [Gigantopelta aegis]